MKKFFEKARAKVRAEEFKIALDNQNVDWLFKLLERGADPNHLYEVWVAKVGELSGAEHYEMSIQSPYDIAKNAGIKKLIAAYGGKTTEECLALREAEALVEAENAELEVLQRVDELLKRRKRK